MYISKLSIRNFRNFKSVAFNFSKGVNTVIGENGSGKTNLLYALRLLIDDTLPRSIKFNENDFCRGLPGWKGHWIIIQIEFSELDTSEEMQSIIVHRTGDLSGDSSEQVNTIGAYSIIFRPKDVIRQLLFDYSNDRNKSKAGLEQLTSNITLNDYEVSFRGRGNADFSIEENYSKYVGNFKDIDFPDPGEAMLDIYGTKLYGLTISTEISCTFIKALRDVESDLRSYRDNPLLNLLRGRESSIDVVDKENIIDQVNTLNDSITELDEVKKVSDGISDSLRQAIGETYAPNIEIKSELPSEMEKLLQSLKLWVGDPDEIGYKGRIWELSLGGANLIYLSLKLLEYEKVKSIDKVANFLLIEEPEAHIHTHIQKTLFQKLHTRNTQVIITTHSTHISSVSKISSLSVLSRGNKEAYVFRPANGLSVRQVVSIERYLDAVRTNLLFAKGVILVEGDAEQIIIPELIRKVFGCSLDELGISLINIGSTGFKNIAVLFHEDRVKKRCAIVTDLDTSILQLPEDEDEDTPEERACRQSQKSGLSRRESLEEFCEENEWVKCFYGKYTFEVDFLRTGGNSYEVTETIKQAYRRQGDIDRISELIDDENVNVSGKEILRLAEHFGKGWFALMLANEIIHLSQIPRHILEALAFVSNQISDSAFVTMAKYRFLKLEEWALTGDKRDYSSISKAFSKIEDPSGALKFYCEQIPADQLTLLLKRRK
jgi:putative ATP-dependent endonuclease of OLD family